MTTQQITLPTTQNAEWGFWGTMTKAGRDANAEWDKACTYIKSLNPKVGGIKVTNEEMRYFLDSKSGRHLADAVISKGSIEAVDKQQLVLSQGFWFFDRIREVRT